MDNNDVKMILMKLLEKPEENENVDFKEKLCLEKKDGKKELAKDLACFANADGGYIIVGVVDETWERVGIESGTFDVKKIHEVARSRVKPSVVIRVHEVQIENLNYGMIEIENSPDVHTVDMRFYHRVGDDCLPLDSQAELLKHQSKKAKYKMDMVRSIDKQMMKLSSSEEQGEYRDFAERIVQSFPIHSFQRQMKAKFSKEGKVSKFIEERVFHGFYDHALRATDFDIYPTDEEIPPHIMNAIALRAYGMMQLVRSGIYNKRDENEEDTEDLASQEITIQIKLDNSKMEDWLDDLRIDTFLGWMETFKGVKRIANDKLVFEKVETLDKEEFNNWISTEYSSTRLHKITRLYGEFRSIFNETILSSSYAWVANVGRLCLSSWWDLQKRI